MTKTEMIDILRGKKLLKAPENNDELLEGLKMLDTIFDEIANELEQSERVVHGHWVEANDGTHYCSNCGHDALFTWDDIDRNFMHSADEVPDFTANYCYCCGAKMEEHFPDVRKKVDEVIE